MKPSFCLSVLIVGLTCTFLPAIAFTQEQHAADQILKEPRLSGGVCCVLGAGTGEAAMGIAAREHWMVHVLESDPAAVERMRVAGEAEGLRQPRLVVELWNEPRLPYLDNLVDIIVATDAPAAMLSSPMREEILRVLRPEGWALLPSNTPDTRWETLRKPVREGADAWTHWEHGPDNNPVSNDALIRAPYRIQWMGLPYYIAMPAITLAAGGRTFLAMGHIAHHEREEPWLNTLLARNGYNGQELWRKKLPDGYLVHRSAFVATNDTFFMIDLDGQGCVLLDPETGVEMQRIDLPETPGYWKWMAMVEGILFVLIGDTPDPDQTTVVRSEIPAWSWEELSTGYYEEQIPWGFGETLVAVDINDIAHQKVLWTHHEHAPIDSRAMVFGGGRIFFYTPEKRIGALDAGTGAPVWSNEAAEVRRLIEEAGVALSSTPGFRTACLAVYSPEALLYQGQTKANLVALSPQDGHLLWHLPKTTSNPNVVYSNGEILAGIGEEGSTFAINPSTGAIDEDLGFRKRSCVRLTATADSLFVRGWPEGLTRFDRNSKRIYFDGSIRPGCNDGVIGANGFLYIGPWLCDCNLSLMGTVTLTSAGDFDPTRLAGERVFAAEQAMPAEAIEADARDWPAYRGGNSHAGASSCAVTAALMPLYTWSDAPDAATAAQRHAHTFVPTAPTCAAGFLFVGGDDGVVRAIDAVTGVLLWRYSTAGPIAQSPAYWNGRVYAGSADGYAYALDARTGRLLWRFRAAPQERRTMVYGKFGSVWPVNSGVLVHDGVAYFAAGIIDYEGTYVYAVDAATGALKWVNNTSGYLDRDLRKGVSVQGGLTIHDGKLWLAAGNVVGMASYDLATGEYAGTTEIGDGSPQKNRGEEIGVIGDRYLIHGGRLQFSVAENVVNPGRFEAQSASGAMLDLSLGRVTPAWDAGLFCAPPNRQDAPAVFETPELMKRLGDKHPRRPRILWSADRLEGSRVDAVALAKDGVVAACVSRRPRSLTPQPRVCVLDRDSGDVAWECELPGLPRLNGIAIDRDGRIFVSLEDGRVVAFGTLEALQASVDRMESLAGSGAIETARIVESVQYALNNIHDPADRAVLFARLAELGVDPFAAGRANGALNTWHLLGPVPWDPETASFDRAFIGEPKVDLKRSQRIAGKRLAWLEYRTIDPFGMVDLNGLYGAQEMKAAYAYAEFELKEDQPCILSLGSNDGFRCWFNDAEAGRHDAGRRYAPGTDMIEVKGVKGVNRLLLKVSQEGGGWAFGVCVTDAAGAPVPLDQPAR